MIVIQGLATVVRSAAALVRTVLCAMMLLGSLAAPVAAADSTRPSFFDSRELRLSDLRRFNKWTATLTRYRAERQEASHADCVGTTGLGCGYRNWRAFLDTLRTADKRQQLEAVNRYMNARPYVADPKNWHTKDHWSTPGEFLARSGDCEDYAIAKFLSLRELGWSADDLRIVAVQDERAGLGHAVLVAYLNSRTWMLDNQIKDVTDTKSVHHYRPIYSLSESAWWLHRAGRA